MDGSFTTSLPGSLSAFALAILCVTVLLAGCARHRATIPPQPPTRAVVGDEAAASALAGRIAALEGVRGPFVLSASEEEVTALAAQNLVGAPVRDLTIWLGAEGVDAQASIDAAGTHTVYAHVTVACEAGTVRIGLSRIALEGHALPRWILASAEKAANAALADLQTTLHVDRIDLSEGGVVVYGASE
jgi:NADPH-dependent ferric siderophore reductase